MQKTSTFLMFVGDQCGKAEEAVNFYVSLFDGSSIKNTDYWNEGEPGKTGQVKLATFKLAGTTYRASDSSFDHKFGFTPAISIFVQCRDEGELERLFEQLSPDGSVMMPLDNYGFSKKFGWVGDRYGVSWQLNLA